MYAIYYYLNGESELFSDGQLSIFESEDELAVAEATARRYGYNIVSSGEIDMNAYRNHKIVFLKNIK